jgi:hypothetical protein
MTKNLPAMAGPAGGLVPFMSARRRHEICDVVFENLGGTQRLEHEANRDQESYWRFMGLWAKGLPRAATQEHTVGSGVEDLLDKLDRAANAKTIDGEFVEVDDATA